MTIEILKPDLMVSKNHEDENPWVHCGPGADLKIMLANTEDSRDTNATQIPAGEVSPRIQVPGIDTILQAHSVFSQAQVKAEL